jgi:hypothetical protein
LSKRGLQNEVAAAGSNFCGITFVTSHVPIITEKSSSVLHTRIVEEGAVLLRLDYLSCVLTILSTILIGKRCWEGWILAAVNSAVVCLIGFRTSQFGFIPANVFCIALYALNLRSWRGKEAREARD